ncbi:hypothetical protein RSOLAG1IB_07012 [Rhizoctonia solani AG-1 IB]|uniref:Uncharacterized protein n=1 Tax=Thanatephorus cucumeris (strain AG1-IB / isolate 7/3/14) TaxID=1108050 RepID=A0A0B7FDR1_THACB|nr:hypothetical protein RSOLAG1IB_07012 [Rhizoctonia solani AG-1 IB]
MKPFRQLKGEHRLVWLTFDVSKSAALGPWRNKDGRFGWAFLLAITPPLPLFYSSPFLSTSPTLPTLCAIYRDRSKADTNLTPPFHQVTKS